MFCSNCGHNISDVQLGGQNAFCPNCGTAIEQPPSPSIPAAPAGYYEQAAAGAPAATTGIKPIVKSQHIIIGGAIALAVIVAAVVLFVFVLGGSPLVGTWAADGFGGERIEFNRNGTGAVVETWEREAFSWRTESINNMDMLFISIPHPFNPLLDEEIVMEYRFIGNDILQTREVFPRERGSWDAFIRVN
ncbi:MAG: zinc ribbon domain-containing protein [Clostridiales bacterium]|jgi:hypothetical protein|nr:zinc ribbon domain-containing protein [Clostridiales bacterium]